MSDYETESSDDEDSHVAPAQDQAQDILYPYPYLGSPFVTKSVINTLDMSLASKAVGEIARSRVYCLQLQSSVSSIHLQHVLFGGESVSFSKISG
jgi:hypothetical protein